MSMPKQKPGKSYQSYQTPKEFLIEVKLLLGIDDFQCDLAASRENSVCGERFYSEEDDALSDASPWVFPEPRWCWLNPPFANIAPWVEKAWAESQKGAKIAMLIPAAVGSNWWRDFVHDKAEVMLINGRISFDGIAPYPRDCALLLYERHPGDLALPRRNYKIWSWKTWRNE